MAIPAVFIHYGDSGYFHTVVKQAERHAEVSVLGNNPLCTFNDPCIMGGVDRLRNAYEHLSTNGYEVEFYCMARWLMLRNWMQFTDTPVCLHLDSDVMLYANPDEAWPRYDQFSHTLIHGCSGSSSFWTIEGLSNFCSFMTDLYEDKKSYDYNKVASHYQVRQRHGLPGGVCDMTLLQHHAYKNFGQVGEMMHVLDGATWDHNINEADQGYDMQGGHKKFEFKNGHPYVRLKNWVSDRIVRFECLHFQGPAKSLIQGAVC